MTEGVFPKPILIEITGRKNYRNVGLFQCACGNTFEFAVQRVTGGYKKSCGCLKGGQFNKTHGLSYDRAYRIWGSMKARCNRKSHVAYKNYGGRGIRICSAWERSFDNFIDDMGMPPTDKHTIDRIDSNGNYEPSNCRWTTMKVQQRNRRNTLYVLYSGCKMRLTEYAENNNMTYSAAYMRLIRNKLTGVSRV